MYAGLAVPGQRGSFFVLRGLAGRGRRATAAQSAWLLPSLADLLFLGCLLGALLRGRRMLSADGDPARHLVVGEQILAAGSIPHQDLFSHTMAGQPFVPYEWLAEVASAASFRLAGLAGPVLLHGAAIGLAFAILFAHVRARGLSALPALALVALAAVTSVIHWLARPHVFTLLGTAAFAAILDGWQVRRLSARWLWALPPIMVVWANLHGGFLIGLILLALYAGADTLRWLGGGSDVARAAGQRLRALAGPLVATMAATLVNPAGPALLAHVTGYLGKTLLVNRTQEYMSPNFHRLEDRFFLAMLLLGAAAMAWSRRRPALHEGLLFLGFAYFALYSARNIPLFAIVATPLLASQVVSLAAPVDGMRRLGAALARAHAWLARRDAVYTRVDGRARGHLWPVAAVAGLLLLAASPRQAALRPLQLEFSPDYQPVAAAAYLRERPPAGNGFNELVWGGYLLRALWPQQRVFIDGQTDFYGEALTRDYLRVVELHAGWERVLDQYGIHWVIYETDSPFVRALTAQPGWQVAFQDKLATVLTRDPAQHSDR